MPALNPDTVVKRSDRIAGRLFEERMLVITARDSMLHRLNETGTFIWEYLSTPRSVGNIGDALEEHFSGFDHARDRTEIIRFLELLISKGMIECAAQS